MSGHKKNTLSLTYDPHVKMISIVRHDVRSLKKENVRNILFGAPSVRTSRRPYDNRGTDCISRKRPSYLATISCIRCTIFCSRNTKAIYV